MQNKMEIKIIKNGPYVVTGHVPLSGKIITPEGKCYKLKKGDRYPQGDEYCLCRCGESKTKPFCDGSHEDSGFDGTETADRDTFENRSVLYEGPGLDMRDDLRCACARFCHREEGNAWELIEKSDDPVCREEAVKAACDCISGRLVALDKEGIIIEPAHEPSIDIIQDPEKGVSGGIFVKGNIPIEGADGVSYEIRNRITLCRCGQAVEKPFCDGAHISVNFTDK